MNRPPNQKPSLGIPICWESPLTAGLVACWLFNESAGRQAAEMVLGNHAVPGNQPSWTVGNRAGPALRFNGTSNYLSVPFAPVLNTARWSIEAYLAATGGAGTNRGFYTSLSANLGIRLDAASPDVWACTVGTGAASNQFNCTGNPIVLGAFVHYVAVYDGANLAQYINGIRNRIDATAFSPQTSGALILGSRASGFNWFPGVIDYFRQWNRPLLAAEVACLYSEPFAMFADPAPRRVYSIPASTILFRRTLYLRTASRNIQP